MMNKPSVPGALSIDHIQVLIKSRSIMAYNVYDQTTSLTASKCISRPAQSRPASVSPNLLDYCLKVRCITASKWISKLDWLLPPSASPNSLDYCLQVPRITASQCMFKLDQIQPPSASQNPLNSVLGVYPWVRSIVISRRTSNFSQALAAASPDILCIDG